MAWQLPKENAQKYFSFVCHASCNNKLRHFDAPDLSTSAERIRSMFGMSGLPLAGVQSVYYLRSYLIIFVIAIIGSTDLPKRIIGRIRKTPFGAIALIGAEPVVCVVLLLLTTAFLIDASFNPFLYFRF